MVLVVSPYHVVAQVTLTEIMYDLPEGSDSGREWIEVYASSPIDLTTSSVVESGSTHSVTAVGSAFIPAGSYAVIADNPTKFRSDFPSFAGFLFDSAFSLNNKGESIAIVRGDGTTMDSVIYTNASGNGTGDSLQRNPGGDQFMPGAPTPGLPIPASGLIPSTPPKKTSAKTKAAPVSPPEKSEIVGKSDFPLSRESLLAAAGSEKSPLSLWIAATSLLALTCGAGLAYSRHLKKDEWDIIEEVEETS